MCTLYLTLYFPWSLRNGKIVGTTWEALCRGLKKLTDADGRTIEGRLYHCINHLMINLIVPEKTIDQCICFVVISTPGRYMRVLVLETKREYENEQMQMVANETASSLLRCNTAMYPITTPAQQKAGGMYCIKYMTKNSTKPTNSVTLHMLQKSRKQIFARESQTDDKGTPSRNLKYFSTKVGNMINSSMAQCGQFDLVLYTLGRNILTRWSHPPSSATSPT